MTIIASYPIPFYAHLFLLGEYKPAQLSTCLNPSKLDSCFKPKAYLETFLTDWPHQYSKLYPLTQLEILLDFFC